MKIRVGRRAVIAQAGVALTLGFAGPASAADLSPTASSSGFLDLPSVKIVHAPQPVATQESMQASAGMRAQKDRTTGRLRAPTPQELLEAPFMEPATPTETRATAEFPSASGGVVATLGESAMVYSIASKDLTGAVRTDCVTDAESETSALAQTQKSKEQRHEH